MLNDFKQRLILQKGKINVFFIPQYEIAINKELKVCYIHLGAA